MKVENTAGIGFNIGKHGHLRMDGTFVAADGSVHDEIPDWLGYSPAVTHLVEQGAMRRVRPAPPVSVEESEEVKVEAADKIVEKSKEVKVEVGVMEATVAAGEDGKLGTDDDKVEIKPKSKKSGSK